MAAAAASMTVDFLRARLLSERSVSRASKERADQLAARVAELEEQVRAVTAQRLQAEREAAEVLAVLESQGFCGSLDDDSGSDNDGDEEEKDGAIVTEGEAEQREQEPATAKGGPGDDGLSESTALQPGGRLSWKGRSVSPRKARQLRQRHRRSYAYLLASGDPEPKYRMGQSCRKNKRKELISSGRSAAPEKGGHGGAELGAELDGEVGGDERSSRGGGGRYVIRCEKDGEMERVLEKQAELIGQYEAEEKAQTDWEKRFNDNRSTHKGDVVQPKSSGKTLCIAGPPEYASEEHAARRREAVAGEHHGQGRARTAAISAQGSSNSSTNQDQREDTNSDAYSSHNANSASSRQLAVRSPSESSPSSDTLVSKVSDWSSSRFHDHAEDGQLDDSRSRRQPSSTNDTDVESVLQALQRARISLQQTLGRPLPPSQVTLALPAPGDEYRIEEDLYDGGDSYRGEPGGSSPPRQDMLALPAPEDYHSCRESASLSVDGADTSSLTEKPSSSLSSPRQEIMAPPAPGDDRLAGERDGDMKIPVSSPGLFRLPTDSFPDDEVLSRSNGSDLAELTLRVRGTASARHDACRDDDEHAGVSAKQFYDPHGSGRCNVPPSSGFTIGGASFLSGIPGLPEKSRRASSLGDDDLFMQRACDYTITNKWML